MEPRERPVGSRYVLEEPIGRGASGTVWRGRVRATGEAVAVKVLRAELAADPDVVTRFLRERSLLLRVHHPHLVTVRDLVVEGDVLALVMELVAGSDLRTHLRRGGPLRPAAAARLMAHVLDALAVTHRHGIVHRDLKPANILLRPGPDGPVPLLSDFGIAAATGGTRLTGTREVLGTPPYLAPETVAGRPPTPAVDVYAAGIVLYELVSGRPPFDDPDVFALLRRHVEQVPARPPGLPEPLWRIIADCLGKDPAVRPGAADLAPRLRAVAADLARSGTGGSRVGADGAGADPVRSAWFAAAAASARLTGAAGASGALGASGTAGAAGARGVVRAGGTRAVTFSAPWMPPVPAPPRPPAPRPSPPGPRGRPNGGRRRWPFVFRFTLWAVAALLLYLYAFLGM